MISPTRFNKRHEVRRALAGPGQGFPAGAEGFHEIPVEASTEGLLLQLLGEFSALHVPLRSLRLRVHSRLWAAAHDPGRARDAAPASSDSTMDRRVYAVLSALILALADDAERRPNSIRFFLEPAEACSPWAQIQAEASIWYANTQAGTIATVSLSLVAPAEPVSR